MKIINSFVFRIVVFLFIIGLSTYFIAGLFSSNLSETTRATTDNNLDLNVLTPESAINQGQVFTDFYLNKPGGYLFKTKNKGVTGVMEFLNKDIQYKTNAINLAKDQSNNIFSDSGSIKKLLPDSFLANSVLTKQFSGQDNQSEHFFYQQKINGIAVFGSRLAVHMKNSDEIYALSSKLINTQEIQLSRQLTDDQARTIALERASQEYGDVADLNIYEAKTFIFNKKLLGIDSDELNHQTLMVSINSKNKAKLFTKRYFVDLSSGKILFSDELLRSAIQRNIFNFPNCQNTPDGYNCPIVRREGQPAVGIADVDKAYDNLLQVYNIYSGLGRASYDNNDSPLQVMTNLSGIARCPNAFWAPVDNAAFYCAGLVSNDTLGHEFGHATNVSVASFIYESQAGALEEGLADVFGYANDTGDWSMGEDTTLGAVRSLDDPTRYGQADRLFSSRYVCSSVCDNNSDFCGVHTNSGVIEKAFYLITTGGSFNGCEINGISKEKSIPLFYRGLLNLTGDSSANFKSFYRAVIQACQDLNYDTNVCNEVTRGLQAVEIDQQPDNSQSGAGCLGIARTIPACALPVSPSSSPTIVLTSTPIPTSQPGVTNTPVPTQFPGTTVSPNPTITIPITAGWPTPSVYYSPVPSLTPLPTKMPNVTLNLKLKFQGINLYNSQFNNLNVRVGLLQKNSTAIVYSENLFKLGERGVWSGTVSFADIIPGNNYKVYIKGAKHMQKKICDSRPVEHVDGGYVCAMGNISISLGENSFDFSFITLPVGDLPIQDGIVNSYDISMVRNNLGNRDYATVSAADVNLDGKVDTQDYALIMSALSVRTDEE